MNEWSDLHSEIPMTMAQFEQEEDRAYAAFEMDEHDSQELWNSLHPEQERFDLWLIEAWEQLAIPGDPPEVVQTSYDRQGVVILFRDRETAREVIAEAEE